MTTASSTVALVAVLLAGAGAPRAATPVNKRGAPGLIQAARQIVGVDLLDGKDGRLRGSFTQAEVEKFAALVRSGSPREAQTMSGPWTSVLRIRTRAQGLYVAYLMDGDCLLLEVPTVVARQLGVAPGRPRHKRVEIQMHYEDWLYAAMEARLGRSDTRQDLPSTDLTLDQFDGKAPIPPRQPPPPTN
jgi:hypothetical protein